MIADFGSCTTEHNINFKKAGKKEINDFFSIVERETTYMYRAPELVDQYSSLYADEQVDVWSLGCILYVMCHGQSHPF